MHRNFFALGLFLLAAGCATTPPPKLSHPAPAFPPEALVTQRGVLTVHGRQFTLNGYVASDKTGGLRLVVTENFGGVLADVLVRSDGRILVMRAKQPFRAVWIKNYAAADLRCLFGSSGETDCPVRRLSPTHFIIERRGYQLDLQTVEVKPGPQPAALFDATPKETP